MKALRKDFYVQIKRTFNRFISILLIVALGVSFYVGIRSTESDMRLSADRDYDRDKIMDIRVVSTLGLTDDDVQAIATVDKIEKVAGAYTVDSVVFSKTEEMTVKFLTYSEEINVPDIQNGKFGTDLSACMIDKQLASRHNLKVGDKITVDNDSIAGKEFTITGIFTLSSYLSLQKGSTTVGTGTLDGLIVVHEEAFDMDCYTDIYARVKDVETLNTYSEAYQDIIDSVVDEIEEHVAEVRASARYHEIVEEAGEELESVKKEYQSGLKEYESGKEALVSAKKEIEEKESELVSAGIKIADSEKELESAEDAYENGSRELASAKKVVEDSEKEYNQGLSEYESGSSEYESGQKALAAGKAEYESGRAEYESGLTDYNKGKAEYESGLSQYQTGKAEYESGLASYNAGRAEYESGLADYNHAKAQYDAAVKIYGESALKEQKDKLEQTSVILAATKLQLDGAKSKLDVSATQLSGAKAKLDTGKTELASAKAVLDATNKKLNKAKKTLDKTEKKLSKAKAALVTSSKTLKKAAKQLTRAKKEIRVNEKELASAKQRISEGRTELEKGKKEIADGKKEIAKAKKKVRKNEKKLTDAKEDLDKAQEEIADAEKEIENIEEAEWYVLDRNYIQTYVEYDSDAERIGKIGAVFPIIFFIVAAMVSLTTMTRMVEEERTQIGTLKALGYGKMQIALKYLAYGALATLLGGVTGGYVGGKIFPYIIIVAYRILYANQSSIALPTDGKEFSIAIVAAFVSVVGATLLACINELRAVPAALMRPEAPKSGKRVMLERIPFLWKRLSFNMKSTFRNLFRYKKRLVMTLFGIGGCTALLVVGFGVRNSVHSILSLQYGVVNRYDVTVTYDEDKIKEDNAALAHEVFEADDRIEGYMDGMVFTADVTKADSKVNSHIVITDTPEKINRFINLHNRVGGKEHSLGDDGVIITEKMASLLGAEVGDTIDINEGDTKKHTVRIDAVAENYTNHYIYMTKKLYDNLYEETYRATTAYICLKDKVKTKSFSKELMDCEDISGVSMTSEIKSNFAKSLRSMDSIVFVLIISAGGLAFVVLYNLNNINIAERKRELATLKVLGFYDGEVSGYVYRENIIITFMGIVIGLILGYWLHKFVIFTAEIDLMMFGRNIGVAGYILSILLTIIFAVLINLSMHFKLKKVDMATSLKSVE